MAKKKKSLISGVFHISSTFNNTVVSLTDFAGNVFAWASSGSVGFKGARKSTPYAAQMASESVVEKAKALGLRSAEVSVRGPGSGRESALRALRGTFDIKILRDVTPIPHNGCKLPKRRRG